MDPLRPTDADETAAAVQDAAAAGRTLEIVGQASRRGFGRPVAADQVLDLSALSRVLVYEPNELVLTVEAATPLAHIHALLRSEGQHLAFEPPDLGPLWGRPSGQGTLGGALATGLGGPRRVSAGAPRDHFLGFKAVNGLGQAFAAGGRVVKNVTGYDLPKLMAGAFGTLAVLTEVTVKVMPAPAQTLTLAIFGLDETNALAALRAALGGAAPIAGAACLPADVAARLPSGAGLAGRCVALLRLEGVAPSVAAGALDLAARLGRGCEVVQFDAAASHDLWRDIGGAGAFAGTDRPVWRLSIPPSAAAGLGEALRRGGVGGLYYDWGGGAIWVEGPDAQDGGAALVRGALAAATRGDGHATLVRASAQMRATVAPFQPLAPGLAALTARVRERFDPQGLFNPGRMGP